MRKTNAEKWHDIDFSGELPPPLVPDAEQPEAVPAERQKIASEHAEADGMLLVREDGKVFYTITVIGQIEGHYLLGTGAKTTKYEHLIPLLVGVEENEQIDGLLLLLNTVGGDVEAGLALADLVASMAKPTVSLVLGGGHSIGVPLAVAAKRSFIVPTATMTLHPVRMNGLVIGVPQTFSYFSKMQERIFTFVAAHSGASVECIRDLTMRTDDIATDVGTIIDGQEAVRCGIIDAVGGLSDALKALRQMCTNSPARKEKTAKKSGR